MPSVIGIGFIVGGALPLWTSPFFALASHTLTRVFTPCEDKIGKAAAKKLQTETLVFAMTSFAISLALQSESGVMCKFFSWLTASLMLGSGAFSRSLASRIKKEIVFKNGSHLQRGSS